MAPKALSPSPQPSKGKPVDEEPSSSADEEGSEDDEGSESQSSKEEKDKCSNDFSGEKGKDEELKPSKSEIDSKSVSNETGSDSDSDLGSPSSYKLQPISRVSKSASKRSRSDESPNPVPNSKISKSEKGKSVGTSSYTPGRLWSDKDEITVLNGLMEFNNNADIRAFHNFIKGKLHVDFSKDQLSSKIKRMKKRFLNTLKKSENGDDPVFSNSHEGKAFELSKRIWGGSVGMNCKNGIKDEKEVLMVVKAEFDEKYEKEIVKDEKEDDDEGVLKYLFLSSSFDNMSSAMSSLEMSKSGMSYALRRLSPSKAEELDKKWKVLITEEIELNHKKLTLMKEQMNMALDFGK